MLAELLCSVDISADYKNIYGNCNCNCKLMNAAEVLGHSGPWFSAGGLSSWLLHRVTRANTTNTITQEDSITQANTITPSNTIKWLKTITPKTQQVINNFSSKRVQDHATSGSFLFPPWVVDEKYGLDQSEAASHTMRHELSLPPFPFPFAFDQWKNSATDEEESYRRLRDPVHVTLITCCVFGIVCREIAGIWGR